MSFTLAALIVTALVEGLERRGLDGRATVPWYFPTAEEYRAKLEARGFTVESIALIPRPTPLPGAMASSTRTDRPFVASTRAAESPVRPAPTTTTSTCVGNAATSGAVGRPASSHQ